MAIKSHNEQRQIQMFIVKNWISLTDFAQQFFFFFFQSQFFVDFIIQLNLCESDSHSNVIKN